MKPAAWILLILSLIYYSCIKENNGNGSILITVKSNQKPVSQAIVYIKANTLVNPAIPLNQYDFMRRSDASGIVNFDDMPPGYYFIYAQGYSAALSSYVHGQDSIILRRRFRQNEHALQINALP